MKEFSREILNAALELATEWGENFRKPIAERMISRFPELSEDEISEIEAFVRKAEYRIYEIAEMEERGEITEGAITRIAAEEFPWMDGGHIGRLKNIGMYYARR
ncbi:MAG: hypothetical protein IPM25_08000 [Chloracidobacterium sp.]|nr:hypothetical protein [Chloracidobacterium sp.]